MRLGGGGGGGALGRLALVVHQPLANQIPAGHTGEGGAGGGVRFISIYTHGSRIPHYSRPLVPLFSNIPQCFTIITHTSRV